MKLVTHDGYYHYDEVLATAILLKLYPNATVIRTRNMDLIESGDIVYDVGRTFNPQSKRFDHHQESFNEFFSEKYTVKMSAAGLIYKYFGDLLFENYGFKKSSYIYEDIKTKVYEEFILPADALDNGVEIFSGIIPRTVQSVVASFNFEDATNKKSETKKFEEALAFVSEDLSRYLNDIFNYFAVKYEQLYKEMQEFLGGIFVSDVGYSSDLIYLVDKKLDKKLQFYINKRTGEYRIVSILKKIGSFGTRYPLLAKWRGFAGDELCRISGIDGCIFVHATGFTGSNTTLEGAIKMCEASLKNLN